MSESNPLPLREFHQSLGAHFTTLNGAEVVADFGDVLEEHKAVLETVGVMDLSFRSRICLTGVDRVRFLHGQATNDVKRLRVGEGCYAALVTAKGKMESDLNIHSLQDELLLDFEPGRTPSITARLEKYIVADDVQVVDVAPHYGLLSVQGPKADAFMEKPGLFGQLPAKPFQSVKISDATLGEIYVVNMPRLEGRAGSPRPATGSRADDGAQETVRPIGFDLFVPTAGLGAVIDKLIAAAKEIGGRASGWTAFETARIEAGIPRFGTDMDETNIPLECGIETRAVSYSKGCYIGQEVINRIHTIGHVNRELRGLRFRDEPNALPVKGDKLFKDGKEVGYITSAVASPTYKANIALGYVRREANQINDELILRTDAGEWRTKVVELPFGI